MDYEVKTESSLASNPTVQSKNGLLYVMPQPLSSSVNKTFIRQQSQRQSYKEGETMVFDMNTGSRYVDPENCMLMFDITTGAVGPTQVAGHHVPFTGDVGALALIEELHVHAKSGVELDRVQECNQYAYSRSKLRDNSDYLSKWGSMWGGGKTAAGGVPALAQINDVAKRVAIPMKLISGLFDPTVKGMKMPPGLISGSRIEITLEEFKRAFGTQTGGDLATTYTVTNPIIVCMAHELSDNSQRVLNEESVENGLEYTYTRVFTTVETSKSTNINIQVKKAVSRGLRAFTVPIQSNKVNELGDESFTAGLAFDRYQYRIGSQFYPQQKIDTPTEGYWTTLNIYNKSPLSSWFASSLSFDDYLTNSIQGAGFETDSRLNLTGVPINNSATLTLESTVKPAGDDYDYFVFLEYVCVCRSFLTNCEIKI